MVYMESLSVYRELADRYDQLGQLSMRDRFLMLAAHAALEAGQPDEADRLRHRLLQTSRHHMLRPYGSFAEAAEAPDVQTYLRDLQANYPPEVTRPLLATLRTPGGGGGGGSTAAATAPVDQTQPLPWGGIDRPVAGQIPPTAPVIDIHGSRPAQQQQQQRPIWQPSTPYPLAK